GGGGSTAGRHRHRGGGGRNPVVLLERLDQVVEVEDGHLVDLLDEVLGRDCHGLSFSAADLRSGRMGSISVSLGSPRRADQAPSSFFFRTSSRTMTNDCGMALSTRAKRTIGDWRRNRSLAISASRLGSCAISLICSAGTARPSTRPALNWRAGASLAKS